MNVNLGEHCSTRYPALQVCGSFLSAFSPMHLLRVRNCGLNLYPHIPHGQPPLYLMSRRIEEGNQAQKCGPTCPRSHSQSQLRLSWKPATPAVPGLPCTLPPPAAGPWLLLLKTQRQRKQTSSRIAKCCGPCLCPLSHLNSDQNVCKAGLFISNSVTGSGSGDQRYSCTRVFIAFKVAFGKHRGMWLFTDKEKRPGGRQDFNSSLSISKA